MSPRDPADCVFCKIIAGEILSCAGDRDGRGDVAFLDVRLVESRARPPRARGSTTGRWPTLSDEAAAEAAALPPRLARAILKATGAEGLNVILNNGRCAGQTVDHGHWHLIPRFVGDPVHWPWPLHPSTSATRWARCSSGSSAS